MFFDDIAHAIAHLCTHTNPIVEPRVVHTGFIDRAARVVGADLLDEPPVAGVFLVGDDDVIVGAFLGASARQSNLDHEILVGRREVPAEKGPEASQPAPRRQVAGLRPFLRLAHRLLELPTMRFVLVALALAIGLGCTRGKKDGDAEPAPSNLRIAVITDLKGYLEPCGCTSRPLGGIDRMAAKIDELRKGSAPLLVLMAGDLFFDAAPVEPARLDQANRNATTLQRVLNRIGVDAASLGSRDRGQEQAVLARLQAESKFPWLAMHDDAEVVRIEEGTLRVAIVGVRPMASAEQVSAAIAAAEVDTDLTIALVYGSRRDANRIAAIEGVDFVVQGGVDEDAPIAPRQAGDGWVLHAGRQGQGLTVVDITRRGSGSFADESAWSRRERTETLTAQIAELSDKIEAWEKQEVDSADLRAQSERLANLEAERAALQSPPPASDGNTFSAQWVELPSEAPTDAAVAQLMKAHDKAVNEANRKAFADLTPPPLGPGDTAYVGSMACRTCHSPAYQWWQGHPHGRAYETLQVRNKEFNLDCVGCHVTGYDRPGGSTVTHNLGGALVDVGCESCHGPGAAHTKDPTIDLVRDPPEPACIGCHNEEHSDQFNYDSYRKAVIVPGHGLPLN